MDDELKLINREVFLGFWKVHILHHASEGEVVGQWMLQELREHGYDVSPGTLYPMLRRMEGHGWLKMTQAATGGRNAPKKYRITPQGRKALKRIQRQVRELRSELLGEGESQ